MIIHQERDVWFRYTVNTVRAFPYVIVLLPAIMKFMGDFPIKGQSEQDIISTILRVKMKTFM